MTKKIANTTKIGFLCLFWMAILLIAFVIGYVVLKVVLYLLPVVLTVAAGLAVLYGIYYAANKFIYKRGNFKSLQKCLKTLVAI